MTALTRALFNPPALRDSSANQSRLTAQTELREGVLGTEGGGGGQRAQMIKERSGTQRGFVAVWF